MINGERLCLGASRAEAVLTVKHPLKVKFRDFQDAVPVSTDSGSTKVGSQSAAHLNFWPLLIGRPLCLQALRVTSLIGFDPARDFLAIAGLIPKLRLALTLGIGGIPLFEIGIPTRLTRPRSGTFSTALATSARDGQATSQNLGLLIETQSCAPQDWSPPPRGWRSLLFRAIYSWWTAFPASL